MAGRNGIVTGREDEETPLLRDGRGSGDSGSEETLLGVREEIVDPNKANQQVGKGRGLLIILSLWGLIFLQG